MWAPGDPGLLALVAIRDGTRSEDRAYSLWVRVLKNVAGAQGLGTVESLGWEGRWPQAIFLLGAVFALP